MHGLYSLSNYDNANLLMLGAKQEYFYDFTDVADSNCLTIGKIGKGRGYAVTSFCPPGGR